MPGVRGESWQERAARESGLRKRTFLVIGPRPVQEKVQGEMVELEFTQDVIDALINGGFIQEVVDKTPVEEAHSEDVAGPTAETRATRARSKKE